MGLKGDGKYLSIPTAYVRWGWRGGVPSLDPSYRHLLNAVCQSIRYPSIVHAFNLSFISPLPPPILQLF